jgi:hypothetical protein
MKRAVALLFVMTGLASVKATSHAVELAQPGIAVHTNWVEHWVTNTAEVRMQLNRFVTEYHTNWVIQTRTNFVDLFVTNIVKRTITNTVVQDAFQTNFVASFQTNYKTLNLTNWTTVVAFKTNWVDKPLTNLVEVEMSPNTAPVAAKTTAQPVLSSEPLALQATRGGHATTNNQVEVQLSVAWTHPPATPVQVQQWRIEREDGSILCFGQDQEFRRALPVGTYKVLVKAQRDLKSPSQAALGTLTVTSREVSLEQRPSRSNSSI